MGKEPEAVCDLWETGGSKEAVATTEAIMEAIEEETNGDPIMPTKIQGYFNEVPTNWKLSK